jgi:hypothetical protein
VIALGFSLLGRTRMNHVGQKTETESWLLGASLLAYIVAFFGIAYFDQLKYGWLFLLGLIPAFSMVDVGEQSVDVSEARGIPAARLTHAAVRRRRREGLQLHVHQKSRMTRRRRELGRDIS